MAVELNRPGLRGVIVGETKISRLEGGLQYRGYCIFDLVEQATFCEVAHLLLFDELPGPEQLADFRSLLFEEAELPSPIAALFEQLPLHSESVEAVRTAISLLAHFDPQPYDDFEQSAPAQAVRLLARIPLLVAGWHRLRTGRSAPAFEPDLSFAANLLQMLRDDVPAPLEERAFEIALIVSAEQEFSPSTYAARLAASTRTDIYSAVLAGVSTMAGKSARGDFCRILALLQRACESGVDPVLAEPRRNGALPGFGHPVYTESDPRAAILERICADLAQARGDFELEETADAIERAVWESEQLPPSVHWPLARLLFYLQIPAELQLPVFLCARAVGWCAHAIEQAREGGPIRPRARYRGAEDLAYVPLYERG